MMGRSLGAAFAIALAVSAGACSGDAAQRQPDEDEIRQALEEYYARAKTVGRVIERHTRSSAPAAPEEEAPQEDGEADEAERPCPRFEFRYMDRDGEWREGSYRLPCEAMDKAESEISRALEDMAQALSQMSETARREIRKLVVTEVAEVERLGCVPAQSKPGFVCDVEATLVFGEDETSQRFLTARFVKSESGWRAFELEEHI